MKSETNNLHSNADVIGHDGNLHENNAVNFLELYQKALKQKICLKLYKNETYLIDGRIITFSSKIKQLCGSTVGQLRIILDTVQRETLDQIIEFLEILEWKKETVMFEVKANELNNWYEKYLNEMDKIYDLAKFLKISHIIDYFKFRENIFRHQAIPMNPSETFKTAVDISINIQKKRENFKLPHLDENDVFRTQNFLEAPLPMYRPEQLSLELPIEISKIKRNANSSLGKVKFTQILKNPILNQLIDALLSDSFWFIVCLFQAANEKDLRKVEVNNSRVSVILKRMSCNYFKFFIHICDKGPSRKSDPVLNVFRDFMSQCVYYSIYLGFPKSRHMFNDVFRNRIISLLAYLYNGLNSENTFSTQHWELDLGKGNIIEGGNMISKYPKDENILKLPDIKDLEALLQRDAKKSDITLRGSRARTSSLRKHNSENNIPKEFTSASNVTILNTPLYRLYAETNKFETLNLVKPIKFIHRKIFDIEQKEKEHANYVKNAKDTLKAVAERKAQNVKIINDNEILFNAQIKEVRNHAERIKKEFQNIKVQRVQEYANYCIFLSSK